MAWMRVKLNSGNFWKDSIFGQIKLDYPYQNGLTMPLLRQLLHEFFGQHKPPRKALIRCRKQFENGFSILNKLTRKFLYMTLLLYLGLTPALR